MSISQLLQALKLDSASMPMGERLLAGCSTALLSMGVVFIILVLIAGIIKIINFSPAKKEDHEVKMKSYEEDENQELEIVEDYGELVSVITAAIIASGSKNIVVKRISRTNNIQSNWEKTHNIEV